jgi:hypothetical protein
MTTIEQTLRKETQELRTQFINNYINWSIREFESYKVSPLVYSYTRGEKVFYSKKQFGSTKAEDAKINLMVNSLNKGLDLFLELAKNNAEQHYENSLLKLVDRVSSKLSPEYLKVESASVGVNINITLSDGTKTVRAWTIIAAGEIQKPHYRYLVK